MVNVDDDHEMRCADCGCLLPDPAATAVHGLCDACLGKA